jgi:hypothetical protein
LGKIENKKAPGSQGFSRMEKATLQPAQLQAPSEVSGAKLLYFFEFRDILYQNTGIFW